MKVTVASLLPAMLFMATSGVQAHQTSQLRGGLELPGDREDGNSRKDSPSTKRRYIAKYRSVGGKSLLLNNPDAKVYYDFDEDDVLVLDLDEDEILSLEGNEDIISLTEDETFEQLGHFVRELDEAEVRRLGESTPYGISMVQADQVSFGPNKVIVCVADTGVAWGHPDLPLNMQGADSISSTGSWDGDERGHGTHIAGTIAALPNGIGVVGVAPGVDLYITRALDDDGNARESDIYEAIKQCGEAGADIISLSLGGSGVSSSFKDLINKLYYEKDILIVAASGNSATDSVMYPAALPNVVAVGAVSSDYSLWAGSNWGKGTELVAPGDLVLSTSINARHKFVYTLYSGTSMATPHVAGVAALLKSHYPKCTNNQLRYAMAYSAMDLDDSSRESAKGCDLRFGNGLVQAKAALDFLGSNPCNSGNWGSSADFGGCDVLSSD